MVGKLRFNAAFLANYPARESHEDHANSEATNSVRLTLLLDRL